MARILFTWELGAGLGHLTRFAPIVQALRSEGHSLTLAARELTHVRSIIGTDDLTLFQAPLRHARPRNPFIKCVSFSQILHNVGYDEADDLEGQLLAWRGILDAVQPQLLIADHSPTALLAARGRDLRTTAIGAGFELPRPGRPYSPLVHPLEGKPLEAALRTDAAVLHTINTALGRLGLAAIADLDDIYADLDEACFLTPAELDHFGAREGVDYLGIRPISGGRAPVWPGGTGPKIYAYLKPFARLPQFLAQVQAMDLRVLIYNNNLPKPLVAAQRSATIEFTDQPLDLAQVAAEARLAIVNANHATTCHLLMHGLPCLMIPLQAEQGLVAERVIRLGAGVAANANDENNLMAALRHMLPAQGYRKAARRFSRKYRKFDFAAAEGRMLDRIRSLLAGA